MNISLLITTYNRPDALEAVLTSIRFQSIKPQQVIVADDGSDDRTRILIENFQDKYGISVDHVWHEDLGFRVAEIRNRALAQVKHEYVVMIDSDIVMDENFIKDHRDNAKIGFFLQGGRNLLSPELTDKILLTPDVYPRFRYAEKGVEMRLEKRLLSFRAPWLTRLYKRELVNELSGIRTCNMSFFFNDLLAVNGFNNEFVGWGREDSELVVRLFNYGVKRYNIKFSALCYHLYHKEESRASLPENEMILDATIKKRLVRCENGLTKFL
ncbi:glycosyltransferase family 2 protein [Sphingobacterium paucimobilis]|uniref:Glycosyltransferase 2-like domain-containing protein n=1 Tax=Sphingobacterium paucimobilis HER1398 TaxID=1346330 RepID=U2JDA6_9SPHI|nr:glycosyltransferase family 2 protein [Sphingobacterium paucimobilis]ERJ60638.1 hypothetical protein M472_17925 [Sphingobacterium paucimobilis HER1398]